MAGEFQLTVQRLCEVLRYPTGAGTRILRELGLNTVEEDSVTLAHNASVLALYVFCMRKASLGELAAFSLCRQVHASDALATQLTKVQSAMERGVKGEGNPMLKPMPVTLYEGRYATWEASTVFDVETGRQLEELPSPPCFYIAMDMTASFIKLFRAARDKI